MRGGSRNTQSFFVFAERAIFVSPRVMNIASRFSAPDRAGEESGIFSLPAHQEFWPSFPCLFEGVLGEKLYLWGVGVMSQLSHFDQEGASRMVDVGSKAVTDRMARASGRIRMAVSTLERVRERSLEKGDVLSVARLAAIMGAKQTATLIPLCHPLALDRVEIDFQFPDDQTIEVWATVGVSARTGVEMEALAAVSVAALTIYDMCKSIDREIVIETIRLEEKAGGRSGHFTRSAN